MFNGLPLSYVACAYAVCCVLCVCARWVACLPAIVSIAFLFAVGTTPVSGDGGDTAAGDDGQHALSANPRSKNCKSNLTNAFHHFANRQRHAEYMHLNAFTQRRRQWVFVCVFGIFGALNGLTVKWSNAHLCAHAAFTYLIRECGAYAFPPTCRTVQHRSWNVPHRCTPECNAADAKNNPKNISTIRPTYTYQLPLLDHI